MKLEQLRIKNLARHKQVANYCNSVHVVNNVPTIYLYDLIDSDPYWGFTDLQLAQLLQEAGDAQEINLRINSPGGDVFVGNAMYALLSQHPANINVYIDGLCASAATYPAIAGSKRVAAEGSFWMVHFSMSLAYGNKQDFRKAADELDKLDNSIAGHYSRLNGDSVEDWITKMDAETWFNTSEAMDLGLITEVWTLDSASNSAVGNWDLSVFKNAPSKVQAPPVADPVADPTTTDEPNGPVFSQSARRNLLVDLLARNI